MSPLKRGAVTLISLVVTELGDVGLSPPTRAGACLAVCRCLLLSCCPEIWLPPSSAHSSSVLASHRPHPLSCTLFLPFRHFPSSVRLQERPVGYQLHCLQAPGRLCFLAGHGLGKELSLSPRTYTVLPPGPGCCPSVPPACSIFGLRLWSDMWAK